MDKTKANSPRKQKQLGPAPIASFEDTSSDELKFKMDLNKTDSQLTDIVEQDSPNKKVKSNESSVASNQPTTTTVPAPAMTEQAPSRNVLRVSQTPRIDISRASSSSQHEDSRDSSPENVFDQVGTGTLQEVNEGGSDLGFGEDGTTDLRKSTEELYYVEDDKVKDKVESDWQQRSSPILFKFDERQQACLQQNARKDSVSSEVAALLCISGRTSRISSVGSQGSAVSRLSAISGVSGVSRSPSPHKMLLETSFCGPKPLNLDAAAVTAAGDTISTDELEQIILARKHDLTKAVLAEGINIDLSTPKKTPKSSAKPKSGANGSVKDVPEKIAKRTQIVTDKSAAGVARSLNQQKRGGVLKKNNCTIVGVTPSGTQYIRIKLKPDELYDDKGLSTNERVIEEAEVSKPDSLALKKAATKKAAPHFSQLVQSESGTKQSDHHLTTTTASPKSTRNALKTAGSRSPSPATTGISISRKSSFCSLFKAKEAASPDSPSGQRKKSAISILLDSPRDRSRSKSRESEKSGGSAVSANSTPSKQRSVLAIFKPRKTSSKSSSPIDPEMQEIMSKQEHQSRKQTTKSEEIQQRPGSTTPRLRYYDKPRDPSEGIIIPLHTPPDEKENVTFAATVCVSSQTATRHTPGAHVTTNVDIIEPAPVTESSAVSSAPITKPRTPVSERRTKQSITKCVVSTTTTPTASAQPKIKKSYRIELPDGSIRIPLRSPSDEKHAGVAENDEADNNSQLWSTTVQRNSSQESQDTIVSSKAPSNSGSANGETQASKSSVISTVVSGQTPPITTVAEQKSSATPIKQMSQDETTVVTIENANGSIRAMSKERKRILFSTKIGSGSEEQIFATQLSLSKTESLSSQLSEQVPGLESPSTEKSDEQKAQSQSVQPPQQQQQQAPAQSTTAQSETVVVRMRSKEDRDKDGGHGGKHEVINVNRHSMYIENIEEIMEAQRHIEAERKNSLAKMAEESGEGGSKQGSRPAKPERTSKSRDSAKSRDSTEERRTTMAAATAGSSGSEHDSEMDPKHRMARQVGAVEEESTGLVSQESYDDELPYVPTTLPEERSMGISIIPVRERALMDVKTCPVERPRSTTPLNISCLQEYCGSAALTDDLDISLTRGEKLRISLPRHDVRDTSNAARSKSPRRVSNTSWFEFAEQGIGGGGATLHSPSNSYAKEIHADEPSGRRSSKKSITEWIDFENIPEKRKPAKRITTLPHKDSMHGESSHHIQYNYVNPDECQCECHGTERDGAGSNNTDSERKESLTEDQSPDDCVPLLESDEENLNRNQATEQRNEQTSRPTADSWRQESFGTDSQDGSKTKRSSFDSGGSQSPVYTRSNKTTTVQLPQRLQR